MVRRYRRYSRRRRYYRSKKKWTAYNSDVAVGAFSVAGGYHNQKSSPCVYGSAASIDGSAAPSTANSAISYYVTRCRIKGVIQSNISAGRSIIAALCYIPHAYELKDDQPVLNTQLSSCFFYQHPEYVLAWNRYDYVTSTGDTGEISLYSKQTRRLNPGDRIVLLIIGIDVTTSSETNTIPVCTGTFSCYVRTN